MTNKKYITRKEFEKNDTFNMYYFLTVIVALSIVICITSLVVYHGIYHSPNNYEGEPCKEVGYDLFVYNASNYSDYVRAKTAWEMYTFENELKGYCKDGRRIGGL
jgi:hypothetical protein